MKCKCGCRQDIPELDKWRGTPRSFIHGHNWRGKTRASRLVVKQISCACGCGEIIDDIRRKKDGRPYHVKFQKGHMWKGVDVKHFWKGGTTDEAKRFKQSGEYKRWRKAVFERDNYTCQVCGIRNMKGLGKTIEMHPDHIKPFAKHPELRTVLSNGRTLCIDCHRKTDTYGFKAWRSS